MRWPGRFDSNLPRASSRMNDDQPESGRSPRRSWRRATTTPPWRATTACSAPDRRRRASGSTEPRPWSCSIARRRLSNVMRESSMSIEGTLGRRTSARTCFSDSAVSRLRSTRCAMRSGSSRRSRGASCEPRRIEAFAGEARARAALGQRGEAEAALAKAIGLAADHPTVRAASEAVARMTGPVAEVAEPAEPITDLPSLAKAFAAMEEEVEPPASSVPSDFQSFVESIEPEKEDTHVLLQLAELAIEGGDPQMGLLRYEQAIQRDPRNADAWTGKGVALQQLERFREALEAYDHALSLKPNHELARKWRETCARHIPSERNK